MLPNDKIMRELANEINDIFEGHELTDIINVLISVLGHALNQYDAEYRAWIVDQAVNFLRGTDNATQ